MSSTAIRTASRLVSADGREGRRDHQATLRNLQIQARRAGRSREARVGEMVTGPPGCGLSCDHHVVVVSPHPGCCEALSLPTLAPRMKAVPQVDA